MIEKIDYFFHFKDNNLETQEKIAGSLVPFLNLEDMENLTSTNSSWKKSKACAIRYLQAFIKNEGVERSKALYTHRHVSEISVKNKRIYTCSLKLIKIYKFSRKTVSLFSTSDYQPSPLVQEQDFRYSTPLQTQSDITAYHKVKRWQVIGYRNGTLSLTERIAGASCRTLTGHSSAITNVYIKGDLLYSGDREGTVQVRSLQILRPRVLQAMHRPGYGVTCLKPGEYGLCVGYTDGSLYVWNENRGSVKFHTNPPDIQPMRCMEVFHHLVLCGFNNLLAIYDLHHLNDSYLPINTCLSAVHFSEKRFYFAAQDPLLKTEKIFEYCIYPKKTAKKSLENKKRG